MHSVHLTTGSNSNKFKSKAALYAPAATGSPEILDYKNYMTTATETRKFEAETRQLLDLMIHSLYTDKEIFLRELVSNASDALDRLRFNSLTNLQLMEQDEELEIRLETSRENRTLMIHDNGIGMSRQEVIDNIGSIAKSGTQEMIEKIKRSKGKKTSKIPPGLIGQFGVGFYSAFMVADKVVLETLKAGQKTSTTWVSEADGMYTVSKGSKTTKGTSIRLHLKPVDSESGIADFTDEWTLRKVVKKYSDFIAYPIRLQIQREEREKDEKGMFKPAGKTSIVTEDKTLNSMKPIWTRPESEVTEEEYSEFYKHIAGDRQDPLMHIRLKAEGISEYESVLFVPAKAPHDLYVWGGEYGLQLYARRVQIMERCETVLPRFLRFIRGVIDSSDLPLNISRQTLQENRHLSIIRRFLTRKVLDMLAEMQEKDSEKYLSFWEQFGRSLKEGVGDGPEYKDRVANLLLFSTSQNKEKLTTLKEYISRMKEGQKNIYYITGESRKIVENSPLLEGFSQENLEVLFLTDPIDELLVDAMPEFEGKQLKSAAKGELDLDSSKDDKEDRKQQEDDKKRFGDLFDLLGKYLEPHVKQVRLSSRLTTSPACLTVDEHDMSPQMERILRMTNPEGPKQKRILEVNGSHDVLKGLQKRFVKDTKDPAMQEYAELLYGYALLADGAEFDDPAPFNKALEGLMSQSMHETSGKA